MNQSIVEVIQFETKLATYFAAMLVQHVPVHFLISWSRKENIIWKKRGYIWLRVEISIVIFVNQCLTIHMNITSYIRV